MRNATGFACNPAYGARAGYLKNRLKPRLAMGAHMPYGAYQNTEVVAEVRKHYKSPYRFGAPDMVVVNMIKDKTWVRDGIVAKYPTVAIPRFGTKAAGGGGEPVPRNRRKNIQDRAIRDVEITPDPYYPEGIQARPHARLADGQAVFNSRTHVARGDEEMSAPIH